ncbi:MAG: hypothetical protein KF831_01405 [Acidobacteria bacterium]|nr:hypothetical protein [Acidobacteriota bacterium]
MVKRFSILAVLLFSLCVSRGEGVHIFPFADAGCQSEAASLLGKGGAKLHGYSIFPQDGFHGQKLTKIYKDAAGDGDGACHAGLPALTTRKVATASTHLITAIGPQRTKFLLTSGSDRSPPPVS